MKLENPSANQFHADQHQALPIGLDRWWSILATGISAKTA